MKGPLLRADTARAFYPCTSQAAGNTDRDGQDQDATPEMEVAGGTDKGECDKSEHIGRDREQKQKRDSRMLSENDSSDQIADGEIGREWNRPADREHGLVECVDDADVDQRRDNRGADRCNNRQRRASPRMEHPVGSRGFDHFFGHQREEEHHGDVVDSKRDRRGEAIVALGPVLTHTNAIKAPSGSRSKCSKANRERRGTRARQKSSFIRLFSPRVVRRADGASVINCC